MSDSLRVWLDAVPIGTLVRGDDELRFLPDGDAAVLSVAAPPGGTAWSPALTRAWFDGLLPEGDRRARVEARFGLRDGDTFGLLGEIGWECAGAVAVLPLDRTPHDGRLEPTTDGEVARMLDALPDLPLDRDDELRMSLGGAQDKLLLAGAPGAWALPLDGAPSTWLIKPEPERWPGLVAAEAWALRLARSITDAAEAIIVTHLGRRPALLVRRYDRSSSDAGTVRVHQEDGCQALGLAPSRKYARPGAEDRSPSFRAIANLLLERAADPPAELVRLLRLVTIAVTVRNADLHGKNLSLLHERGTVRLAPVYDLLPTVAFIPGQWSAGMPVGGAYRLDRIGSDHLVSEATSWGLPERVARETIGSAVAGLQAGLDAADAAMPAVPPSARDAVVAGLSAVGLPRPGRPPSRARAMAAGRASVAGGRDDGASGLP